MSDNPNVAVLRNIVAEIREELALVEGDRMEYPENAYRVSAGTLEEWADRLQEAMLAALEAQASAPEEVLVDFPGIGMAGPFTPAGNMLTLPAATMTDLAHYFRRGYVEQASAPGKCDGDHPMNRPCGDPQCWHNEPETPAVIQASAPGGEVAEVVARKLLGARAVYGDSIPALFAEKCADELLGIAARTGKPGQQGEPASGR